MSEENNFTDVNWEDADNENTFNGNIRGKALYYSTSQVASILEETDSKIRYYSTIFDDILHIKTSNKQRQYTQEDINKLEFIISLKNEGMTLKQIKEYCEEVNFDASKPVVKESNPLAVQAMAQALLKQQETLMLQQEEKMLARLENMKSEIVENTINELREYIDRKSQTDIDGLEILKEDIGKSVNNIVSEKIDNVASSINEIKENMNTKYVSREEIESYGKKKSIWSSLFSR